MNECERFSQRIPFNGTRAKALEVLRWSDFSISFKDGLLVFSDNDDFWFRAARIVSFMESLCPEHTVGRESHPLRREIVITPLVIFNLRECEKTAGIDWGNFTCRYRLHPYIPFFVDIRESLNIKQAEYRELGLVLERLRAAAQVDSVCRERANFLRTARASRELGNRFLAQVEGWNQMIVPTLIDLGYRPDRQSGSSLRHTDVGIVKEDFKVVLRFLSRMKERPKYIWRLRWSDAKGLHFQMLLLQNCAADYAGRTLSDLIRGVWIVDATSGCGESSDLGSAFASLHPTLSGWPLLQRVVFELCALDTVAKLRFPGTGRTLDASRSTRL